MHGDGGLAIAASATTALFGDADLATCPAVHEVGPPAPGDSDDPSLIICHICSSAHLSCPCCCQITRPRLSSERPAPHCRSASSRPPRPSTLRWPAALPSRATKHAPCSRVVGCTSTTSGTENISCHGAIHFVMPNLLCLPLHFQHLLSRPGQALICVLRRWAAA